MGKWYQLPTSYRMTEGEYHTNLDGVNVVFGAALGFVLARSEQLATREFILSLLMSAGCVVAFQYLRLSPFKLFYSALTAVVIALLPGALEGFDVTPLPKLQPLLAVWAAVVLVLKVHPRKKTATDTKESA